MIFLDELDNLKLYKKQLFLPINEKNKRKGSAVFLLTPNYESSKKLMNNDSLVTRWFESYYIEKDISYFINQEGYIVLNDNIPYNVLNEELRNRIVVTNTNNIINEAATDTKLVKVKDHPLYDYLNFDEYDPDDIIEIPISDIKGTNLAEADIPNTLKDPKSLQRALKIRMRKPINRLKRIDPTDPSNTAAQVEKIQALMNESALTTEEKKKLKDSDYGLLKKKKYPMPDKEHVLSAIRFFNYVDSEDEKELADNINKKIKEYKIEDQVNVGKNNRFSKYCNEESIKEYFNSESTPIIYDLHCAFLKFLDGHSTEDEMLSDVDVRFKDNSELMNDGLINDIDIFNDISDCISFYLPRLIDKCKCDITKILNKYLFNDDLQESYMVGHVVKDYSIDKMGLMTKDSLIMFNENMDETIMNEANKDYNPVLYKLLYNERYRTPKEVIAIYDNVKIDAPYITKTYLDYTKYSKLNLFVDLSFYNQTFFKNNIYKLDKGIDLYFEFITRFLKDSRLGAAGYNKKTVFIPVDDWTKPDMKKVYNYTEDINPLSMICRLMGTTKLLNIQQEWKDIVLVLFSAQGYFKIDINSLVDKDISQIQVLLNKLKNKDVSIATDNIDSPKAIVATIVDKIEISQNIEINNLTGKAAKGTISNGELDDKLSNSVTSKTVIDINKNAPSEDVAQNDDLKNELVTKLKDASKDAASTNNVLDDINNDDDIKKIIDTLSTQEDNSVKINAARSARVTKLNNDFLDSKLKETTVKQMIEHATNNEPIPKTELKIDSVNEEWKDLRYMNFEKIYNPADDIVTMINSFSDKTAPVMVRNLNIEDSSTTEDYKDTWTAEMEDVNGTRFTLKFDIPKFKENKFMLLGGNEKTINGQLVLLPIIKTDEDTVQIVSNYNKIFIRRFGTSKGKSNIVANRLIKALSKENPFKVVPGDNTKICSKYELPIDYIDLASQYSKIETKKHIFYFNQDEIREKYKDTIDLKKGIPICVEKVSNNIIYFNGDNNQQLANLIRSQLIIDDSSFEEIFENTSIASRYTYSKASILNTEIPLILVMAYSEGLPKVLKKAHINYEIIEKRPAYDKNTQDIIKFKDAYILYTLDYNSSLLMNGFKECGTELYSISEITNKTMYLDFLDLFGGRLRADGLDNFHDLMIDVPITKEILEYYKLPTDYIEVLAYANSLLGDNKYIRHTDQRGRRYRSNEIVAGYAYQALADSYGEYKRKLNQSRKATMVIKQNEVINRILLDPTASDLSTLNPILEQEAMNTVSTKGLVGMNSDRGYSLDKRTFDKSMINVLGLSTGFAGNVGISRQATIDMNIEGKRGYIKVTDDPADLNVTKSLTITEALTPFGTNMDDPFRSAMTFIQTSKHGMRIAKGMPSLITNGADEALPFMVTDKFAFKAKEDGKVIERSDDYMIVQYKSGAKDFVDLRNNIKKNSDGGFYITLKLDSDYKKDKTFKKDNILAYDKLSFSDMVGHTDDIGYNLGVLVKIAILNTDEGYEDSAIISEYLSEAMASEVVVMKDISLPKNTNIYNIVKKGEPIQEGDPLIIFQNSFDEEDANLLLKNLAGDEEDISDLGRIRVKSKITGNVENVKIYRTVEKEELSDSLKKTVNQIEKPTKQLKDVMKKYDIDEYNKLDPDYKLDSTGKLKNTDDGILIEFYLKYKDKMSVGDKLIYYSALKGVIKDIFPLGKEPSSEFRKDEKIHTLLACSSVNGRMVGSILLSAPINKIVIELDRAVKTELEIPFKYLDEE